MNIFFLARSPYVAAAFHCDKHVVKMCLETAQILSTVHHLQGSSVTYKPTHAKHPCVQWANSSKSHYQWLQALGEELCREYEYRYEREHGCKKLICGELKDAPITILTDTWIDPPKCMPDEFKRDNVIDSYHEYYRSAKRSFAKWTKRSIPCFM